MTTRTYIIEVNDDPITGYTKWIDSRGEAHKEDGPAIEYISGTHEWWIHGKRHRTDGPAIIFQNGREEWWINGQRHREDGPAIELSDGRKIWCFNGYFHRNNGPAIEHPNGHKEFFFHGKRVSEEELKTLVDPKQVPAHSNKIIELDGKKYKLVEI